MEESYKTSNWFEIVWLTVNERRLVNVRKIGEKHAEFEFESKGECERLVRESLMGRDHVSCMKVLNATRQLRILVAKL